MYVIIYKGIRLWFVYVRDDGEQTFKKHTSAVSALENLQQDNPETFNTARVVKIKG